MIILVCSWLRRVGNASQGVSLYFINAITIVKKSNWAHEEMTVLDITSTEIGPGDLRLEEDVPLLGQAQTALPEMEKRADSADISVLFFLIAVLIFWLYTRKQTVLFCTVLLALYY